MTQALTLFGSNLSLVLRCCPRTQRSINATLYERNNISLEKTSWGVAAAKKN